LAAIAELSAMHNDSRTTFKPEPSYYTYGLISTARPAIFVANSTQTREAFKFLRLEPASF
jgi:hypothetical protein